jgi:hypothetical protein
MSVATPRLKREGKNMEEVGAGGSTWGSYAFCASIIRVALLYVKTEIKINSTVCSIQYVNYSSATLALVALL